MAVETIRRWLGSGSDQRWGPPMLTLYNIGARVSEITGLRRDQFKCGPSTFVHLLGKGRKHRDVPLWPKTAKVLKAWFREQSTAATPLAFPSARGQRLSRNGVDYILQQAVAGANCQSLKGKRIHPHAIRHTTGSHLLQAGVNISVIALWLGQASRRRIYMLKRTWKPSSAR